MSYNQLHITEEETEGVRRVKQLSQSKLINSQTGTWTQVLLTQRNLIALFYWLQGIPP